MFGSYVSAFPSLDPRGQLSPPGVLVPAGLHGNAGPGQGPPAYRYTVFDNYMKPLNVVGTVRANSCTPLDEDIFYFEVTVLDLAVFPPIYSRKDLNVLALLRGKEQV